MLSPKEVRLGSQAIQKPYAVSLNELLIPPNGRSRSSSRIQPSLRYGGPSPVLRTRRSSKTTFALRATARSPAPISCSAGDLLFRKR
jgi:hypothetical protein